MAHEAGKGSKRRPTDEEAYADNYRRIFEQKIEWEDEIVKEDHNNSLKEKGDDG
tara:strand:- start:634 stop:795 length:162 start_codon:yes stop_codon:yes gene_type:complete